MAEKKRSIWDSGATFEAPSSGAASSNVASPVEAVNPRDAEISAYMAAHPTPSKLAAGLVGGMQGLTAGFADEIAAGAGALMRQGEGGSLAERYRNLVKMYRERDKRLAEGAPTSYGVGQLGGNVGMFALPGAAPYLGAQGVRAGAGVGAALGGIGAVGRAEGMPKLGDVAMDVLTGAASGAGGAGAVNLLNMTGAGRAVGRVVGDKLGGAVGGVAGRAGVGAVAGGGSTLAGEAVGGDVRAGDVAAGAAAGALLGAAAPVAGAALGKIGKIAGKVNNDWFLESILGARPRSIATARENNPRFDVIYEKMKGDRAYSDVSPYAFLADEAAGKVQALGDEVSRESGRGYEVLKSATGENVKKYPLDEPHFEETPHDRLHVGALDAIEKAKSTILENVGFPSEAAGIIGDLDNWKSQIVHAQEKYNQPGARSAREQAMREYDAHVNDLARTRDTLVKEFKIPAWMAGNESYARDVAKITDQMNRAQQAAEAYANMREAVEADPVKVFEQYARKSGPFAGTLEEVTGEGKTDFGRRGDQLAHQISAEWGQQVPTEEIRERFERWYQNKQELPALKRSYQEARDKYLSVVDDAVKAADRERVLVQKPKFEESGAPAEMTRAADLINLRRQMDTIGGRAYPRIDRPVSAIEQKALRQLRADFDALIKDEKNNPMAEEYTGIMKPLSEKTSTLEAAKDIFGEGVDLDAAKRRGLSVIGAKYDPNVLKRMDQSLKNIGIGKETAVDTQFRKILETIDPAAADGIVKDAEMVAAASDFLSDKTRGFKRGGVFGAIGEWMSGGLIGKAGGTTLGSAMDTFGGQAAKKYIDIENGTRGMANKIALSLTGKMKEYRALPEGSPEAVKVLSDARAMASFLTATGLAAFVSANALADEVEK